MQADGRALIVEDNPDTRDWLGTCVASAFPSMSIVPVGNLADARKLLAEGSFHMAVIDLGLPDGSGIDLIRELHAAQPDCHTVVATIYDDDRNLFAALKAGARGYVLKDQDRERIVGYLQGIQHNRPALSDTSSQRLIAHFNNQGNALKEAALTAREEDVICLIAKGLSAEEAARTLNLSPDTVKGYLKSIHAKLGVSNRAELTLAAVRMGLISD